MYENDLIDMKRILLLDLYKNQKSTTFYSSPSWYVIKDSAFRYYFPANKFYSSFLSLVFLSTIASSTSHFSDVHYFRFTEVMPRKITVKEYKEILKKKEKEESKVFSLRWKFFIIS